MDTLTLGYLVLLVVGIIVVVRVPKARGLVVLALVGVAGWFAWAFFARWEAMHNLGDTEGAGFVGQALLLMYVMGFLIHLAAAAALFNEIRGRGQSSADEAES